MHCFICDSMLPEVQFNSDHGDIDPCPTCLFIIQETVGGHIDKPYAEEGDFGEEPELYNNPHVDYWE